jgi:hypothetical protein
MKLVCQGACGLGGQDWEGPHRVGGQARIRSHRPGLVWWVGSTVLFEDSTTRVRQPDIGSDPTHRIFMLLEGDV